MSDTPDPDPPPPRITGSFRLVRRSKRDTADQLAGAGEELEERVAALETAKLASDRSRRRILGLLMAVLTTAAGSAVAAVKGITARIEADARDRFEREQMARTVEQLQRDVRDLQRRVPDPTYWPTPWGHQTPDPKGPQ